MCEGSGRYPATLRVPVAQRALEIAVQLADDARRVEALGPDAKSEAASLWRTLRWLVRAQRGLSGEREQLKLVMQLLDRETPRIVLATKNLTHAITPVQRRGKVVQRAALAQWLAAYEELYAVHDRRAAKAAIVSTCLAWNRRGGRNGWTTQILDLWFALTGKTLDMAPGALREMRRAQLSERA